MIHRGVAVAVAIAVTAPAATSVRVTAPQMTATCKPALFPRNDWDGWSALDHPSPRSDAAARRYQNAYDRGRADARADFSAGLTRLLIWQPGGTDTPYYQTLAAMFDIHLVEVPACLVDERRVLYARGYNDTVNAYLDARYLLDVSEEAYWAFLGTCTRPTVLLRTCPKSSDSVEPCCTPTLRDDINLTPSDGLYTHDLMHAYDRGQAEARADFAAGRLRLLRWGFGGKMPGDSVLSELYGVQLVEVGGCGFSGVPEARGTGYNDAMNAYLDARYGYRVRGLAQNLTCRQKHLRCRLRPTHGVQSP